jgi:hypothetical protein
LTRRALPLAVAVIFAVPGCGGDDSSSDEDDVREVVRLSITTSEDEPDCRERLSDGFIAQTYGSRERCVRVQGEDKTVPADDVEFASVEIDGDTATADIAIQGGDADGAEGAIELVREGGDWRIDEISVPLLRSLVETRLRARETGEDLPPAALGCVQEDFRSLEDSEFRRIAYELIGQTEESELYTFEVLAACEGESGRSVLREVFDRGIAESLTERGTPAAQVRCALEKLRAQLPNDELPALLSDPNADEQLGPVLLQALKAC